MYQYLLSFFCLALFVSPIWGQELPYFNYTISESDKSLWGICQQHQVTVESVKALNQLQHNRIRAGMKIKIPKPTQRRNAAGMIQHLVTKADKSLWGICQRYAVEIDSVLKINKMPNAIIRVGDWLKIPSDHLVVHIVSKADKSLWRICKNYGVNLAALKDFNNKKKPIIHSGERILIPKAWVTKTEIITPPKKEAASLWEALNKPVFDWARNESKFPNKEKKNAVKTREVRL